MSYTITTKATWSQTMTELENEFRLWGVSQWDTNYPRGARLTGWYQSEEDRTVILKYTKNGKEISLKYGKQNRAVDNLRALYLTINDMRMTEKRGVSDLVESAYKQLGTGSGPILTDYPYKDAYAVLGITKEASLDVAEAAYRTLARKAHPDGGGNPTDMQRINEAIAEIRKEKGV